MPVDKDTMFSSQANRFQEFFEEDRYISLKNSLYNYLLRKKAVEKSFANECPTMILEVGSGISPVMTRSPHIVYTDLSSTALGLLRRDNPNALFVAADNMHLPFKSGVFSHTISSEVIEHIEDDRMAIQELSRVMMNDGRLVITFPHRKFYFANDDRFVGHYRRYELLDMEDLLEESGLRPIRREKVLGPLDKIAMSVIVFCYTIFKNKDEGQKDENATFKYKGLFTWVFKWINLLYGWLAWLDSRIMPYSLCAVVLIKAKKMK